MEAYQDFAYVYDEFMDATPYEEWCTLICGLIEKYGVSKPCRDAEDVLDSERNLVLDLGCGTGLEMDFYFRRNPAAKITGIDLIIISKSFHIIY